MEKVASGRAIPLILDWGYLFEGCVFQRLDHESFIWQEEVSQSGDEIFGVWLGHACSKMLHTDNRGEFS